MKDSFKKKAKEGAKVAEYQKLKEDYKELEKTERHLRDYLNTNVFDYAQNTQKIEDIFLIRNSSMSFLNQTQGCLNINPNLPVIEINNLTKYYSSRRVPSLTNVTIKVHLGDFHVIVGPDGSGKTTLFNCLRGIEDYEGDILIDGRERQLYPDSESQKIIGFVPKDPEWKLYSTVEEIILNKFMESNLTEIEAQNYIRSSLEQMKISYLRNIHVVDLNLLEKKKIQIILGLIDDPHVIIFDEIFLGLQHHECLELASIFKLLMSENRALVVLSYSFNDFCKFANKVTVMSEGRVFYTGTVKNLFYSYRNSYSVSTSDNKKAMDILMRQGCNFYHHEEIDMIYVSFDGNLRIFDFQSACIEENLIINEFKSLEMNLNDIFPFLKEKGNADAIKEINTSSFFVPE